MKLLTSIVLTFVVHLNFTSLSWAAEPLDDRDKVEKISIDEELLKSDRLRRLNNNLGSLARGTESSGGGDGVYIDNELVMRDFVSHSTLRTIYDNGAFLREIPDLSQLLIEVALVFPELAVEILNDLAKVNYFVAETELPLLNSDLTAIAGPDAEVQLAIRHKDDIVLTKDYASVSDLAYLIVHEALHGVLVGDSSPMHHHRVRNIVNYLKSERGQYKEEQFKNFLNKNGFKIDRPLSTAINHYASPARIGFLLLNFDQNLALNQLACFNVEGLVRDNVFEKMTGEFILSFGEIPKSLCLEEEKALEEFLSTEVFSIDVPVEYKEWHMVFAKNYQYGAIREIELESTRFYQRELIERQKKYCKINDSDLALIERAVLENEKLITLHEDFISFEELHQDLNGLMLIEALKFYLYPQAKGTFSFSTYRKDIEQRLNYLAENLEIGRKNQRLCIESLGK